MLKWIILIIVVVALYFNFRTEESRKNFFSKFKSTQSLIAENKTAAYEKIDQLTKDGNIVKTNPAIEAIFVDENWWTTLSKEQKIYDSMLFAIYMANEGNKTQFNLKIMNGNGKKQFGSYTTYEGYKDYDAFDFGKLSK